MSKKLFQNLTWDGLQSVSVGLKSNLQLGFETASNTITGCPNRWFRSV